MRNKELEILDDLIEQLKTDVEGNMEKLSIALQTREKLVSNHQILVDMDKRFPMTSTLLKEFSHINAFVAEMTGDN